MSSQQGNGDPAIYLGLNCFLIVNNFLIFRPIVNQLCIVIPNIGNFLGFFEYLSLNFKIFNYFLIINSISLISIHNQCMVCVNSHGYKKINVTRTRVRTGEEPEDIRDDYTVIWHKTVVLSKPDHAKWCLVKRHSFIRPKGSADSKTVV